jgi:hypothetical protein
MTRTLAILLTLLASPCCAQITANLVEYWKLDAASGDETGSVASIVLTDGNTVGTAAGKIGTARDFENGSDEYMTTADSAALSTGDIDFTVGCWVQLESEATVSHEIVSKWIATGNHREFILRYDQSSDRFMFIVSPNGTSSGNTTVAANTFGAVTTGVWYFVVAGHDAANNVIFISVNGVENTAAHTTGLADRDGTFDIGRFNASTVTDFDGLIDEVGFWKKVLTSTERAALYAGGNGRTYPFPFASAVYYQQSRIIPRWLSPFYAHTFSITP